MLENIHCQIVANQPTNRSRERSEQPNDSLGSGPRAVRSRAFGEPGQAFARRRCNIHGRELRMVRLRTRQSPRDEGARAVRPEPP